MNSSCLAILGFLWGDYSLWPPFAGHLQDGVLCDEDAWGWVHAWEEDGENLQADGHQQRRYAGFFLFTQFTSFSQMESKVKVKVVAISSTHSLLHDDGPPSVHPRPIGKGCWSEENKQLKGEEMKNWGRGNETGDWSQGECAAACSFPYFFDVVSWVENSLGGSPRFFSSKGGKDHVYSTPPPFGEKGNFTDCTILVSYYFNILVMTQPNCAHVILALLYVSEWVHQRCYGFLCFFLR